MAAKGQSKRAVLYLRVSSQAQVDTDYDPEGNSIPAQRTAGVKRAAELGAEVVGEYVEPGKSATSVDGRPQFREMMARIKHQGDVDYVIVYARSRMHRDTIDAAITKRDLRAAGVSLVSVMDYTEDTYIGDLVATVLDGVNEYQSRASGADISYKMAAKAANGGTPGMSRLGYLNVRDNVDGREVRTVAPDPDRAPFIVMLFELYATGKHSFPALREAVTKAGLRTRPTKKNPAGSTISIHKIGKLLRDRYYLGYVQFKGKEHEGRHQALITQELFDRVQRVLDMKGGGTRKRVYDHYLKGILWCRRCDERIIVERGKSKTGRLYFYFLCIGRQRRACDLPRLPVETVEREVEVHFSTLQIPQALAEKVETEMDEALAETGRAEASMRRGLNTERKRLARLEDQYLDLVGHPDWPQDKLTSKMREIRQQKADVEDSLRQAGSAELTLGRHTVVALMLALKNPQALYRRAGESERKTLAKTCFDKLFIDADNHTDQPRVAADELKSPLTPFLPSQRTHHTTNGVSSQRDAVLSSNPRKGKGSSKNPRVEPRGLEPLTPSLPVRCATSCATAPRHEDWASLHIRLGDRERGSGGCESVVLPSTYRDRVLNLDRPVRDRLLLRTVPGAVDYLFEELRTLPGVEVTGRRRDGLVVDVDAALSQLAPIRYFSHAAVLMHAEPAAELLVSASTGALSALTGDQVRFRVGDLGEDRWRLRDALESAGWVNAPGDWDVNLDSDDDGVIAEIGALHWTKRFGALRRAPASTNPVIAAVMTRLAKIDAGHTVLDPMCGAGSLLVEAGRAARPARLLGADHDRRWVGVAGDNLADHDVPVGLWRGDVRAVPLGDDSVDRVLANLPFGKRVGSHIGNKQLYPKLLREVARLLPPKGRAVLLTEDKRLFTESVQRTRGLRVVKEIVFASGGAHPSAYVVTTRRGR